MTDYKFPPVPVFTPFNTFNTAAPSPPNFGHVSIGETRFDHPVDWKVKAEELKETVSAIRALLGQVWEQAHDSVEPKVWTDLQVLTDGFEGIIPLPIGLILMNGLKRCDMAIGPCACGATHTVNENRPKDKRWATTPEEPVKSHHSTPNPVEELTQLLESAGTIPYFHDSDCAVIRSTAPCDKECGKRAYAKYDTSKMPSDCRGSGPFFQSCSKGTQGCNEPHPGDLPPIEVEKAALKLPKLQARHEPTIAAIVDWIRESFPLNRPALQMANEIELNFTVGALASEGFDRTAEHNESAVDHNTSEEATNCAKILTSNELAYEDLKMAHASACQAHDHVAAERDKLRAEVERLRVCEEAEASFAGEIQRYREALGMIQTWDALNPPPQDGSDLPWLKRLVDLTLEGGDPPRDAELPGETGKGNGT